jgi:ribonuclease, Rne/Rng family
MPNSLNNDGISRKIGDIEERKKLKTILSSVNIPENMSVIVRTAGIGKTKKEISKDLSYLTNQWNKIRENTIKSQAPSLIYEEGTIIKRVIRDLLTDDVEEILVEGKDGYDIAKQLTKNIVPTKVTKVKLYKGKDKSLFSEQNIENQINELFSLSVKLQSGGSIVINTTEALVAIDVNSGKNTSERNIESTALKTNLEAATEIARQLRLRDLGGLVVIDFIDMDDYRNNFKVEKAIKNALFKDRARVQIGRISMFGLLELSRQRLRSSLIDRSFEKCPYCNGTGLILNTNTISEQIIKLINEKLMSNKS